MQMILVKKNALIRQILRGKNFCNRQVFHNKFQQIAKILKYSFFFLISYMVCREFGLNLIKIFCSHTHT